jgi:hypothetical protein
MLKPVQGDIEGELLVEMSLLSAKGKAHHYGQAL